ncbi:MAG TPA: sugar phosphate isomerase/epimerase family protein [Oscillatoriaceae cyanobacterium]
MVPIPFPLAISSSLYGRDALPDALPRLAELGFRAVELVADVPQLFPAHWSVGQVARLAEQIEALELHVTGLSAETGRGFFSPIPAGAIYEPALVSPQAAPRRLRLQHLQRCLDFAFALGAPCVVLNSGPCLPGIAPPQAWEALLEGLTVLLSYAEELGILLAIAPRPGHVISRVSDFRILANEQPHPLLGLHLDLAQLVLDDVGELAIGMAAGRIWSVAVTDAKRPHPYRLRPGHGDVGLASLLEALRRVEFRGPLTLHLENEQEFPEHAAAEAVQTVTELVANMAIAS